MVALWVGQERSLREKHRFEKILKVGQHVVNINEINGSQSKQPWSGEGKWVIILKL